MEPGDDAVGGTHASLSSGTGLADSDPEDHCGTPVRLGAPYRAIWEISLDGTTWCEVPDFFIVSFKSEIVKGDIKTRQRWP